MGRRVPVRKTKKIKLGCHFGWPFWPKDLDRVDLDVGGTVGMCLVLGCTARDLGMQLRLGVENITTVQTIRTLPTGFVMGNKMC